MVCFSSAKGIGKPKTGTLNLSSAHCSGRVMTRFSQVSSDRINFLRSWWFKAWPDFLDHKVADHRATQYCQIPDEIKNLVPHKFVLVPQSIFVEDPEVIDHNGVVQGTAKSQAVFPQSLKCPSESRRS